MSKTTTEPAGFSPETERFILANLDVMEISAHYGGPEESHTGWSLGYAPEREENGGRVIFGELHSAGPLARGQVLVTAMFFDMPGSDLADEEIEEAIVGSMASETLYDYARTALATVLGTIEAEVSLPRKSPTAKVSQLVRRQDAETADS